MSTKALTSAWLYAGREYQGGRLLVLLALADEANDDGVTWPSAERIAEKARLTVRRVRGILDEFRSGDDPIVRALGQLDGNRATIYQVAIWGQDGVKSFHPIADRTRRALASRCGTAGVKGFHPSADADGVKGLHPGGEEISPHGVKSDAPRFPPPLPPLPPPGPMKTPHGMPPSGTESPEPDPPADASPAQTWAAVYVGRVPFRGVSQSDVAGLFEALLGEGWSVALLEQFARTGPVADATSLKSLRNATRDWERQAPRRAAAKPPMQALVEGGVNAVYADGRPRRLILTLGGETAWYVGDDGRQVRVTMADVARLTLGHLAGGERNGTFSEIDETTAGVPGA